MKLMTSALRPDFLSSQKLLADILLQKKSTMQELAANILMRISVLKIVCELSAFSNQNFVG